MSALFTMSTLFLMSTMSALFTMSTMLRLRSKSTISPLPTMYVVPRLSELSAFFFLFCPYLFFTVPFSKVVLVFLHRICSSNAQCNAMRYYNVTYPTIISSYILIYHHIANTSSSISYTIVSHSQHKNPSCIEHLSNPAPRTASSSADSAPPSGPSSPTTPSSTPAVEGPPQSPPALPPLSS